MQIAPEKILDFNNKILHPEEKLARQPIRTWIRNINVLIKSFNKKNLISNIENIALIFNQSTYIMAAIGDFDNAHKYCYKSIILFNNFYNATKKNECLNFCIQPWINLSRLNRICGNMDDAIHKLQFLVNQGSKSICIYEDIISKSLQRSLPKYITEVIDNAYILDSLRTYLKFNDITKIITLKEYHHINHYHLSVITEAEIIFYNRLKEFQKSYILALNGYKYGQVLTTPVFLFRIIELISLGCEKSFKLVDTLMKYIFTKLKSNSYNLYDLIFMYEAYKHIFYNFKIRNLEILLLFQHAFQQFKDEPARIDCFRLLSFIDKTYKQILSNLIEQSSYSFINNNSSEVTQKIQEYSVMLNLLDLLFVESC